MPTRKSDGQETGPRSLMKTPGAALPVPMPTVLDAAGPDNPTGGGVVLLVVALFVFGNTRGAGGRGFRAPALEDDDDDANCRI